MNNAQKIGPWVFAAIAVLVGLLTISVGYVNQPIQGPVASLDEHPTVVMPEVVIVIDRNDAFAKDEEDGIRILNVNDLPDVKPIAKKSGATYKAPSAFAEGGNRAEQKDEAWPPVGLVWACKNPRALTQDTSPRMEHNYSVPQTVAECRWEKGIR